MAKLKRMVIPLFWKAPRKASKWIVAPRAGGHRKLESVPLQVLLRDILGVLEKGKEARTVIKRGDIFVDGRARKDHAYPVGLFDVVHIPVIKKSYRAVPSKKGLKFVEIPESESNMKICKVVNKKTLRGGKTQLNLHDGKTLIVEKDEYKTGDSLLVQLPELKILEHVKLEKGVVGIVTKGADAGKTGKVKDIVVTATKDPTKITYESEEGEEETLKDRFVVVGKKPMITVA